MLEAIEYHTDFEQYENDFTHREEAAESCAKIAEEAMIEFSEWCSDNSWIKEYSDRTNCWRNTDEDSFGIDYKSTIELLQLFKQSR